MLYLEDGVVSCKGWSMVFNLSEDGVKENQ